MKDNFSAQASVYARFRPVYPPELIQWLAGQAPSRAAAWDCGTGNGQVALALADYFGEVHATDISEKQIGAAPAHPHVRYAVEPAERCTAPDQAFDLVTVAQAIHWFHFEPFYEEVRRVLKPGGLLAVIGYGLFRTDSPAVDAVADHFYGDITGPYWDPERRYIDEQYRTIPFPFAEIEPPPFAMRYEWTLDMLIGFLNSWSAVQHYIRQHGRNPLELVETALQEAWGEQERRQVEFPLLLRAGR